MGGRGRETEKEGERERERERERESQAGSVLCGADDLSQNQELDV